MWRVSLVKLLLSSELKVGIQTCISSLFGIIIHLSKAPYTRPSCPYKPREPRESIDIDIVPFSYRLV